MSTTSRPLPFWILIALLASLGALGYRLVVAEGGLPQSFELRTQVERQRAENLQLHARNQLLEAEIVELKSGMETVEERARHELGMVANDEVLFLRMN